MPPSPPGSSTADTQTVSILKKYTYGPKAPKQETLARRLQQGSRRPKRGNEEGTMSGKMDFYSEKKWCEKCGRYVHYLMSMQHSYCVECGEIVTIFNKEDAEEFHKLVEKNKFKAS